MNIDNNKKHKRRLLNLLFGFTFLMFFITMATYAWFVGTRTVNVTMFDIDIAGTDSLLLSLDGETWGTIVTINESNFDLLTYPNNTNTWGGRGLIPVSTIGDMNAKASRMTLFEKTSYTATAGGYRIMSSPIDNYSWTDLDQPTLEDMQEPDGYVAFDLFVRNFSGRQYLTNLNILDEEAIYLTHNSAAIVSAAGVANTGIENSVRVAFAQIGRVHGETTDPNIIRNITCNADAEGKPIYLNSITGICRNASIWEPNDENHVTGAINWYNKSCRARNLANLTLEGAYSSIINSCGQFNDGDYVPTYAVNDRILSSDHIDVYDGAALNGFTGTVYDENTNRDGKLTEFAYFTDSKKNQEGTAREEIFTLAPNSITKVRIYVYIEGQDVDNYDFATIGKAISINFGFTKQRYTDEENNDYNLPSFGTDKAKPEITLLGSSTVSITSGTPYIDAGATAFDPETGENLTRKIVTINPVDVNTPGTYYITYNVSDWWGNYATQVTRVVTVN